MERRPGTPSLLRELNDRAALDLLLPGTPLTRTQISEPPPGDTAAGTRAGDGS